MTARARRPPPPHASTDPEWYRDAVIYELHVRAFTDSDGDGRGDFRGLTSRLDWIGLAATGPGVQAVSAVARLFGGSVAQIARESLRDFKALAEAGEIPKAVRN